MRTRNRSSVVPRAIAVLAVLAGVARAFPEYFVENGLAANCLSHPTKAYGGHKAPVQDKGITFQLTPKGSTAPSTSVCPGVEYAVSVSYGGTQRRALLTVNEGKLATSKDPTCPSRAYSSSETDAADAFTDTLTVPCDAKGPSIDLQVTSAGGSRDAFHQSATKMPLEAVTKCPSSTCKGAPAAAAAAPAAAAATAATAATTAAAAAAATTAAIASPTAAAMQQNQTAIAAATPKNAQSSAGSGCGQSQYGYACKAALQSGASLHFTRGGQVPPSNPCTTTTQNPTQLTATGSNGEPVHFLLESPLSGYAGLAFPVRIGRMVPADAVIGWVDPATAQPKVSAYTLLDRNVNPSTTNFNEAGWTSNMGVAKATGSNGASGTLLCFSRLSQAPAAQYSKALDLAGVDVNWVAHDSDSFVEHKLTGWVTVNLESGTASGATSSVADGRRHRVVLAHGALMLLAFTVFFPLGALAARHKWLAGDNVKGGIRASWFHAHRASQILGLLLSLAGFILALVVFDVSWKTSSEPPPHKLYDLHRILGVVVMAFVVIQAAAGILRPKLSTNFRPAWRFGHLTFGWLTTALGIVVVFNGVIIMHDLRLQAWVNWLLPTVLFLGLLLLAGLVLEVLKLKLQTANRYRPASHYYEAGSGSGLGKARADHSAPATKSPGNSQSRLHSVNAVSADAV